MIKQTVSYYAKLHSVRLVALLILLVAILTRCISGGDDHASDHQLELGMAYIGDQSCRSCHAQQVSDHYHTAHHSASAWGNDSSILGSFEEGKNHFFFSPRLEMRMEKIGDSVFQTAYLLGQPRERRSMDLVFGSGTKGQSFASWQVDRLFQLPITWFTPAQQWSNSPGFPGKAVFNRPITARCLECHISYAKQISPAGVEPESFDRSSLILSVTCEKCHGPGDKHVAFHTKNVADSNGRFIANPANFSRQQRLDLCGLCHGGRLSASRPAFSFTTGDPLSDYFKLDSMPHNPFGMDVHGNQLGLLSASKCFTQSDMTCNSCHDPHKNERGQLAIFSQRCQSCHGGSHQTTCSYKGVSQEVLQQNCIDCHMEKEPSRSVAVQLEGRDVPTPALMRSHFIRIPKTLNH